MSFNAFAAPIRFEPRPSRRFAVLLGLVYAGALLSLWPPQLPWPLKLGLAVLLLADAWRNVRRYVYYRHPALAPARGWVLSGDVLLLGGGAEADIEPSSLAHPQLIVLNLRLPPPSGAVTRRPRRASLVLFADSLEPVVFRRLQVRLRHRLEETDEHSGRSPRLKPWQRLWHAVLGR